MPPKVFPQPDNSAVVAAAAGSGNNNAATNHGTSDQTKNWPRFYPLVRHKISEIPEDTRPLDLPLLSHLETYRKDIALILAFLVTAASYFMNILAMTVLLFSHAEGYASITGPILSLIYFVLCPFLAFFGWHWMLYRACKSEASFLYIAYFAGFGVQIGFFVFLGLGLFNGGGG